MKLKTLHINWIRFSTFNTIFMTSPKMFDPWNCNRRSHMTKISIRFDAICNHIEIAWRWIHFFRHKAHLCTFTRMERKIHWLVGTEYFCQIYPETVTIHNKNYVIFIPGLYKEYQVGLISYIIFDRLVVHILIIIKCVL